MKQLLQSLRTGVLEITDVPCPSPLDGQVLVRTRCSLISSGTERMLLDFGKANWIDKARQQPDKVRMVLEKMRTDGFSATLESVRAKLDVPVPLGYSTAGHVVAIGPGVTRFALGDRVATNGPHAESSAVPQNLCAHIPDGVSDQAAAFTVLGSIALEGIRLVQPALGECVAVTGLGLIGLLTVQLLRANGCRVLGIDFDSDKCRLAHSFGAETVDLARGEDPVAAADRFSRGRGVDAVLITAATRSSEPVHQAALMSRKRGRIVLVGVTGLELSRDDFYKKELSFQVSCSYGPGRYDSAYESGRDYPQPYVRWTAQRNFEAVLEMLSDGRLDVAPLVSHRFPLAAAADAYALVQSAAPHLGIVLEYDAESDLSPEIHRSASACVPSKPGAISVACIGAGAYACKVLLPALRNTGVRLRTVASSGGVSAAHAGRKFGFETVTTNTDAIFADPSIEAVVIATRHDSHAELVCRAIEARKHVFVEKPLATTREQLDAIEQCWTKAADKGLAPVLMVGFNRRFAPQVRKMRALLGTIAGPKAMVMTVNAGAIPADHWTQDRRIGGGRVLGEACHFVDLLRFLADHPVAGISVTRQAADTITFTLSFSDGSLGTVHYFATGHKAVSKERLEVFAGGKILQLDNFRTLTAFGFPRFRKMKLWRQDKGNSAAVTAFIEAVRTGGPSPISFAELIEVSNTTLEIDSQQ